MWRRPCNTFRQGDTYHPSNGIDEFVGIDDVVCIADAPELLGVVHVLSGNGIQPLTIGHDMLDQQREAVRLRYKAASHVGDGCAVCRLHGGGVDAIIAAGEREWTRFDQQHRVYHTMSCSFASSLQTIR